MKKTLFFTAILLSSLGASSQVAVNITGNNPDASSGLDVNFPDKGLLIPRMTQSQREGISQPASSLLVYQTDADTGYYFNYGTPSSPDWRQLVPNPVSIELDMSNNKITNLPAPTANLDAVNKEYVDNAVAALGGGGGGAPTAVSNESPTTMTVSAANSYCNSLSEGGNTDWRLPSADELTYFMGTVASTEYLWTKSLAIGKENPVNQNYITLRLSDGKWRNGGEITGLILGNSTSGNTSNATSIVTYATLGPIVPGNVLILTNLKFEGRRNSNSPCCASSSFRLKFNFADGSSAFTQVYTSGSTSYTTFFDMNSIPLTAGITPISSIELQGQAQHSGTVADGRLTMSGYEITMAQADGGLFKTRCVR